MVTSLVNKYFSEILSQLTVVDSRFPIEDETLYSFNCSRDKKRSPGQCNIFTGVCLSTGGGGLNDRDTPGQRHPHGQIPSMDRPPTVKSGRYASYWNTFLFPEKNTYEVGKNLFCTGASMADGDENA